MTATLTVIVALDLAVAGFPSVHSMEIEGLRHQTLVPQLLTSTQIDSVAITQQPGIGRAILQDDGTIVVNLDGTTPDAADTSFIIEVTQGAETTSCVVDVTIPAAGQSQGWAKGSINMQPVDPVTGLWDFLPGEGFKTWYVDNVGGMSVAAIAADAGLSESNITGQYLMEEYPTYGGSEATAIDADVAFLIQGALADRVNAKFLLKSGTDVSEDGGAPLVEKFGKSGISSIYPVVIGSYGAGEPPIYVEQKLSGHNSGYKHYERIQLTGHDEMRLRGAGPGFTFNKFWGGNVGTEINEIPDVTVFNSRFMDTYGEAPSDGDTDWTRVFNVRASALYINYSDGHSVVYCLFDRGGYDAETYRQDAAWNLGEFGLPPSKYSHNVYTQYNSFDISYIGNLSFRSASQGLQLRPGGMIFDNFCARNLIGLTNVSNNRPGSEAGQSDYSLHLHNLVTQGMKHEPSMNIADGGVYDPDDVGAHNWGLHGVGKSLAMIGDLVMNVNDPNNPLDTEEAKDNGIRRNLTPGLENQGPLAKGSDYLIHNWDGTPKFVNSLPPLDGDLNEAVLNANTTVQLYADTVLSTTAGTSTVDDLIDHYRGLDDFRGLAAAAYNWFANGIAAAGDTRFVRPTTRTVPQTVKARLDPEGRTSGKWWNTPYDWDTGDYAGAVDGDSADMQGHRFYAQIPHALVLADLILGDGGAAIATGGEIEVSGTLSAVNTGEVGAIVGGRMIFDGYSGAAQIDVTTTAGLVANKGTIAGNMNFVIQPKGYENDVRDYLNMGHVMLCTSGESVTIGNGDVMEIHGYTDIAFDGPAGVGTLNFDTGSLLKFVARGTTHENNEYEFGVIRNKQTGIFGDVAPAITSVVNLNSTPVEIDATGMAAGTYVVMSVDELYGELGTLTVTGNATIAKVGNTLEITVS